MEETPLLTPRRDERFFSSTRGQVVSLLRRGSRTVDELAGELDLTDNAIRAHLIGLERDGLVRQGEPRRGGGKPSLTFELTEEAERLFPKAYGVLLTGLLSVLAERLPPDELADVLREVGHRVPTGQPRRTETCGIGSSRRSACCRSGWAGRYRGDPERASRSGLQPARWRRRSRRRRTPASWPKRSLGRDRRSRSTRSAIKAPRPLPLRDPRPPSPA